MTYEIRRERGAPEDTDEVWEATVFSALCARVAEWFMREKRAFIGTPSRRPSGEPWRSDGWLWTLHTWETDVPVHMPDELRSRSGAVTLVTETALLAAAEVNGQNLYQAYEEMSQQEPWAPKPWEPS